MHQEANKYINRHGCFHLAPMNQTNLDPTVAPKKDYLLHVHNKFKELIASVISYLSLAHRPDHLLQTACSRGLIAYFKVLPLDYIIFFCDNVYKSIVENKLLSKLILLYIMTKLLNKDHQTFNAKIYAFIFTKLTNISEQLTVKNATEYHSETPPVPPGDLPATEISCNNEWTHIPYCYDAENQLLYRNMTNQIISFIQKNL